MTISQEKGRVKYFAGFCGSLVIAQPFAHAVPSPLFVTPGSPGTGIRLLRRRVRLHSFSENHFKNWLFLSLSCGRPTRIAAKLRPYGASNNAAATIPVSTYM